MLAQKNENLHAHSTDSDGKLTHIEILNACAQHNIGIVAFTDHDSILSTSELEELRNTSHETQWISGIEISSALPIELGAEPYSGLHILGLFVDPTNPDLIAYCKRAKTGRIERMQKIVKNLQSIGINITEEACLQYSNGESVTRPHIVQAILEHEENITVLHSLAEKMQEAAKHDANIMKMYVQMIEKGISQYPFTLFLSNNAFIQNIYVDYTYMLDLDKTVSLIRNAGGLAFLAHYFTIKNKIDLSLLQKLLEQKRLDGVEAIFGFKEMQTSMREEIQQDIANMQTLLKKTDALGVGSCDAHSLTDYELFEQFPEYAKMTRGLTTLLLKKTNISTKSSSLRHSQKSEL